MRRDTPFKGHGTCYEKHAWNKVSPSSVKLGDTIVAAAGLGKVTRVIPFSGLMEFAVTGKNGNVRASGSPLTYYSTEVVYIHDDKKCKCQEED